MKKIVVKLDYHDDKGKQKAMQAVSSMTGISSISIDAKEKKLTVVGEVDAVDVAKKLRKVCNAHIVSVGPPEEKKKEEPKKEEKKEEPKKEEKKEDPKKAEEEMKKQVADLVNAYKAYNPHYTTHYIVHSAEENPNSCVIS